jgi:hypothetical protein
MPFNSFDTFWSYNGVRCPTIEESRIMAEKAWNAAVAAHSTSDNTIKAKIAELADEMENVLSTKLVIDYNYFLMKLRQLSAVD